jgi:TM2 domain-containing membrane protein YozV
MTDKQLKIIRSIIYILLAIILIFIACDFYIDMVESIQKELILKIADNLKYTNAEFASIALDTEEVLKCTLP